MTVEQFDKLTARDFENGAVRDEMRRALEERNTARDKLASCRHEANNVVEEENALLRKALEEKEPLMGCVWPMLRVWGEECFRRKMRVRDLEAQIAALSKGE